VKTIVLLTVMAIASPAILAQNKLSWRIWRAEFQVFVKQKGLEDADECTSYTVGGKQYPDRLFRYYDKGFSVEEAFYEMGCDSEVFEKVWMKELRRLAKARGIAVARFDEEGGEALYEYLWLEFFLEGKPPKDAITHLR
jgi:hypothetical protein